MTKGATSKVISRLVEKGLAERQLADGRAREQSLVLTPAEKVLVPQLAALADANDDHFFGHLQSEERKTLMNALQALVEHHQLKDIPTAR
jgi:DNA-binding MarR family transcriptional regulator